MFEKTKALVDSFLEMNIPGFDLMVCKDGKEVLRYMGGVSDRHNQTPMRGDELFDIFSCSKVITCTAALQLWEQGKFDLEDELSKYLPEYKNAFLMKDGKAVPVKSEDYAAHVAEYGLLEAAAPAGIEPGEYSYMEPTPFGEIPWTVTINEDGTAVVAQPENEGMGNPTWTATVVNNADGSFTTADCVGDGPQIAGFWKDNGITWINNGDGTVTPVE